MSFGRPRSEGLMASGYNESGRILLRTLTKGIRAHGRKNLKNLESHGDGGAC